MTAPTSSRTGLSVVGAEPEVAPAPPASAAWTDANLWRTDIEPGTPEFRAQTEAQIAALRASTAEVVDATQAMRRARVLLAIHDEMCFLRKQAEELRAMVPYCHECYPDEEWRDPDDTMAQARDLEEIRHWTDQYDEFDWNDPDDRERIREIRDWEAEHAR